MGAAGYFLFSGFIFLFVGERDAAKVSFGMVVGQAASAGWTATKQPTRPPGAQLLTLLAIGVLVFPGDWVLNRSLPVQAAALGVVLVALVWLVVAFSVYGGDPRSVLGWVTARRRCSFGPAPRSAELGRRSPAWRSPAAGRRSP